MKPLNRGQLQALKNLSVTKSRLLKRGNLTKIVPFETKHFVPYLKHVRYLGCSLLGGFTAFIFLQHAGSNKGFAKYLLPYFLSDQYVIVTCF